MFIEIGVFKRKDVRACLQTTLQASALCQRIVFDFLVVRAELTPPLLEQVANGRYGCTI